MSQPTSAEPQDSDVVFHRLRRPNGEIRISLGKPHGRTLAAIWFFFRGPEGDWRPHWKRGITFRADEAREVGEALLDLAETFEKREASKPSSTIPSKST